MAKISRDIYNPSENIFQLVSTGFNQYFDMMVESWGNSVARDRNLLEPSRTNLHNNKMLYEPIVNQQMLLAFKYSYCLNIYYLIT